MHWFVLIVQTYQQVTKVSCALFGAKVKARVQAVLLQTLEDVRQMPILRVLENARV